MNAKVRCPIIPSSRRAVTLIEMLIVVAIIGIMVSVPVVLYVTVLRAERGTTRQRETMEQLGALDRSWRHDVRGAHGAPATFANYTSKDSTLILETTDVETSVAETRIYNVRENPDRTFAVERIRMDSDGRMLSAQLIVSSLDAVKFGRDASSGLFTMFLDATRGFYPHNSRQQFTALAAMRTE